MLRALTHLGTAFGRLLAGIPVPRPLRKRVWTLLARALGARVDEAAESLEAYPDFQAFFTRKLRPGVHRLAAGSTWVAPADCCWLSHVRVDGDVFVPAKRNRHRLGEFLDGLGPTAESPWRDGLVSTFYLRPKDYHRVHSPCAWTVEAIRHVPGTLFPVNDFGQRVPGLFARNERVVLAGRAGGRRVFLVFVGAFMVGSVRLTHPGLQALLDGAGGPVEVGRGAELGMFEFGSTVIVVVDRWAEAARATPAETRMGDAVFSPN